MRAEHRIQQSLRELRRLRSDAETWSDGLLSDGVYEAHRSQLETLRAVLAPVFEFIESEIDSVDAAGEIGTVYDRCRLADERTDVVRRFWVFFAEKFAQRQAGDPRAPSLAAADEVIWSCWVEPFRRLGQTDSVPAAPLAHIESAFVPSARLKRFVPDELRPRDRLLQEQLSSLPFATVAIPERAVDHPWVLGLIAHEIAHHLQHELADGVLVQSFEDVLAPVGGDWMRWSEEIFADLGATLSLGEPAVAALDELVTAPRAHMAEPDERYPSPETRLALMGAWLAALGVGENDAPAVEDERFGSGVAVEAAAVATLGFEIDADRSIATLFGWEDPSAGPAGRPARRMPVPHDDLALALLDGTPPQPDTSARGGRRAVAATVAVHRQITRRRWAPAKPHDDAPSWDAERQVDLAARCTSFIASCREPGTRAGSTSDTGTSSASFIDGLRRLDVPDLEQH